MRFFRSFSLLRVHRRAKSDSATSDALAFLPHTRPYSFHHFSDKTTTGPSNDILSSAVLHILPPVTSPVSAKVGCFPRPMLAVANTRILELEGENSRLKDTMTHAMANQFASLRAELLDARSDLYAERLKNDLCVHQMMANQALVGRCGKRLEQYEKFIKLLLDIGLHPEPVLSNAHRALQAGEDADVAVVESIKEAAAGPNSAWAVILSSVAGPHRTHAQYMSALNLILKVRRELKETKKMNRFWQRLARERSGNVEIFVPSPSNISSIHESLGPERQVAMNALLVKRQGVSRLYEAALPSTDSLPPLRDFANPDPKNQDLVVVGPVICERPKPLLPSVSAVSSLSCSAYVLPPLASESFKQEVSASYSTTSRLVRKSNSSMGGWRRILGEIDQKVVSASQSRFVTRLSNISVNASEGSIARGGQGFEVSFIEFHFS